MRVRVVSAPADLVQSVVHSSRRWPTYNGPFFENYGKYMNTWIRKRFVEKQVFAQASCVAVSVEEV